MPTPGASTIEQVSAFLKCKPAKLIKTLIYVADGQPIAVLVRGDHEANEGKIRRARGKAAKARTGHAGNHRKGDRRPGRFRRAGGNEGKNPDPGRPRCPAHRQRRSPARTRPKRTWSASTCTAISSSICSPTCGTRSTAIPVRGAAPRLALRHAIEVGHVFKLGTKYTDALNAKFLDADEQLKPIIMGCYGIGINRIIAALVETSNDKDGIIWPVSLAPYEVLSCRSRCPTRRR